MTVASLVDRNNYIGSNITGPYAYTFRVVAVTDLLVTTRDPNGIEATLVYPTDFTATGVGTAAGGTITLTLALATGWAMSIRRVRPLTQGTSFRNQGPYFAETHEEAFDNAMFIAQQMTDEILRSAHLPESIDPSDFNTELPGNLLPGNAIVVNATGDGFAMGPLSSATLSAWSAAHNQKLDVFTSAHGDFVAGTTTTLTLAAVPGGLSNVWVTMRISGLNRVFETDEYSVSGAVVTFTSPIPTGTTRVEIRYFYTYQINTADAANVTYTPASGPGTNVQARLRSLDAAVLTIPVLDEIHLSAYCVGDGTTDDTVGLQTALTAGAAQGRVVSGGNLKIKITGPVTMTGPGLIFNGQSFGSPGDAGIIVSGTGYTALTVGPCNISHFHLTLYGTGNTANGIKFNNVNGSLIQKVRVVNLDGFGWNIDKMWDTTVLWASVELCGNASNYAFSMNPAGDTCNMSHFVRLQVEQANKQAIHIDGSTLSCVFDNIHSERATADPAYITWDMGAARSVFNAGRYNANNPTDATLVLKGENTVFNAQAAEGAITVQLDAESISTITLVAPNFSDAASSILLSDHSGLIQIVGGTLGTFNASAEPARKLAAICYGTRITTLSVGDVGNPGIPAILQFHGCPIGTLASASTNSAATFVNCTIDEGGSLLQYHTVLIDCTVTCASTMAVRGAATMRGSTINGNTLVDAGATLMGYGTRFNGTLGQTTACSSLFDAGCYATGTVTGLGVPTVAPSVQLQVSQVWRRGQRAHNLAPAAGGTPGWVCTTGGAAGTFVFKAESNLAP